MRYITEKERRILDRLERLAWGDSHLVDEAFEQTAENGEPVDLFEIARYIVKHRDTSRQPVAVGAGR
jgi:hypothetical protein